MKYLGIHKLLWFIMVIIYTIIEGLLILLEEFIIALWNFKLPKKYFWADYHYFTYIDGSILSDDKNIIETIKRRYSWIN